MKPRRQPSTCRRCRSWNWLLACICCCRCCWAENSPHNINIIQWPCRSTHPLPIGRR